MPDCPPPNEDCNKPIGSPPVGDPCSPCFASTPADVYELVQRLSAEVCALTTRLNNMYQLLGRTRNRLTIIEDTVNNLPDEDEITSAVGCGGLETTATADAILVCDDGQEKAIVPTGEPLEIQICASAVRAVPRGLTYHPITPTQFVNGAVASGSYPITLPSFPTDVCGQIVAVLEVLGITLAGPSGAATSYIATINSNLVMAVGASNDQVSDHAFVTASAAATTLVITKSGSGTSSISINCIGYFY